MQFDDDLLCWKWTAQLHHSRWCTVVYQDVDQWELPCQCWPVHSQVIMSGFWMRPWYYSYFKAFAKEILKYLPFYFKVLKYLPFYFCGLVRLYWTKVLCSAAFRVSQPLLLLGGRACRVLEGPQVTINNTLLHDRRISALIHRLRTGYYNLATGCYR